MLGIGAGFGLAKCSLAFGLFLPSSKYSERDHEIYRYDLPPLLVFFLAQAPLVGIVMRLHNLRNQAFAQACALYSPGIRVDECNGDVTPISGRAKLPAV